MIHLRCGASGQDGRLEILGLIDKSPLGETKGQLLSKALKTMLEVGATVGPILSERRTQRLNETRLSL